MGEWHIGRAEEFEDTDRKILSIGGVEVGVFLVDGRYYAYENRCVHQGGPVCEGLIMGKVRAVLEEDKNLLREEFTDEETHLVCPWHGYEYDITTGRCAADRRIGLRSYDVIERAGNLYVLD